MKIICNELILEITQRTLHHPDQGTDMSAETMEAVCSKVFKIHRLVLTGGEPSLAPEVIDLFTAMAGCLGIPVDRFTVTTNGEYVPAFSHALQRLYRLCTDKKGCALLVDTGSPHSLRAGSYCELPFFAGWQERLQISVTSASFHTLSDSGRCTGMPGSRIFVNAHGEMGFLDEVSPAGQLQEGSGILWDASAATHRRCA